MGNMDKEWIPIGERNTVYFAELHPGDYTFEVRAANLSNNWSDTPTRLNITVLPPWWASTPAYASYIVVTLAIIVGFFLVLAPENQTGNGLQHAVVRRSEREGTVSGQDRFLHQYRS
ncbi:hypothetical protein NXW71_10000 [Parabacteroides merdae]|nr:hypothetical protein [Parabacteroides merdae]